MAFFRGTIGALGLHLVRIFINRKGKLGLRVLGMHQECRAAIHVGAEKTQAFIRSVPRLDHDVVQFVAQEIFDHAFVARLDFKEIGEHSRRSHPALHDSRLKEPPH